MIASLEGLFVSDTLRVGPLELEVLRRGSGRPILLVHGINPVSPHAGFLDRLDLVVENGNGNLRILH